MRNVAEICKCAHADNTATTSHSVPKELKALISFLNELGAKKKLQSFNLNDILKGSWDFT